MIEGKKVTTLLVLKVLEEYSDQNNYLTQKQILDKVFDRYGVEMERKSVATAITLLQDLDYDIDKGSKGGFALLTRVFEPSEVTFLVDAIFSSKAIKGTQARDLAQKISSTLSKNERKTYAYLNKSDEINRTSNSSVFYNIEIIQEAIKNDKWIEFKYLTYDKDGNQVTKWNDYLYHVSPCYMINSFGKYYLLGTRSNHPNASAYRIDYMKDVKVFPSRERVDPSTVEDFKNYRSITEYINDHIYIFGGLTITATMEIKPKTDNRGNTYYPGVQYVKDWFGKNATFRSEGDKLIARVKSNGEALFYWVMQYASSIHLLTPEELVNKVKSAAQQMVDEYK